MIDKWGHVMLETLHAQKNSHQSDTAVFRMQEDLFRTHHRGVTIQDA